ncbi:MAG: FMN-binding protein [Christensenellales bacterium]
MKKGILAALALSLALPACALGEAGYTAGTYSAEAQGMESAVKVTVTVSDSAITDLTIDVSGETAGLGTEVGEPLKAAILEAQSADVDGVAGATVSSTAVKTAVKACLDERRPAQPHWDGKFTAGTYTASAMGKNAPRDRGSHVL